MSEPNPKDRPPTDYRRLAKENERRLLVAAILLLVIIGGGLTGLLYGSSALVGVLPCLLTGVGLLLGLYLLMVLIERWLNR